MPDLFGGYRSLCELLPPCTLNPCCPCSADIARLASFFRPAPDTHCRAEEGCSPISAGKIDRKELGDYFPFTPFCSFILCRQTALPGLCRPTPCFLTLLTCHNPRWRCHRGPPVPVTQCNAGRFSMAPCAGRCAGTPGSWTGKRRRHPARQRHDRIHPG